MGKWPLMGASWDPHGSLMGKWPLMGVMTQELCLHSGLALSLGLPAQETVKWALPERIVFK
ncbi:hypothetical protein EYF80_061801 [Liparis tanakae]|uniref:Uncharacterized protein n=1 Tax=Liparis tanakae TaxID=230148 RepID=A0A4Z2EH98_9TELE|nr:hypothetical protein EYF80_061801 [Liparis tanakae]